MATFEGGPRVDRNEKREGLMNRLANIDLDDFVREEIGVQINKARSPRDFERIQETLAQFEPTTPGSQDPTDSQERQAEKKKFRVAMTDADFEVFDSNNNRYTFDSAEEQQSILEAVTVVMGGGSSDKYDIDILDTIDGQPVFPPPESTGDGGGAGGSGGGTSGGGDAERGRAGRDGPEAPGAAREVITDAELMRRVLADRPGMVAVFDSAEARRRNQPSHFIHAVWPGRRFTPEEGDKIARGESILPPETPAAEAGAGDGGGDAGRNEAVGKADAIALGPTWAAGYFGGVTGDFNSWRKFDAARFADVKVLTRDEIRRDSAKEQLLGELMISLDPAMAERLANRIASQTLNPGVAQPYDDEERKFEEFARFELSAVYKRFETVEQKFDIKALERLLATRDDLRQLIGQRGPEHTLAEFKKEIMHTLVRSRADSDKFFDNFKKLTEREATSRGQAMERKIQAFCDNHKIPRANYDMLIVAGDKKASRENLERYIHDHSGKFRKWVDTTWVAQVLPGTSYRTAGWQGWRARRVAPTESKMLRPRSWATSDIHEARRDIGEFLSMSVAGPEFRQRLEHYAATGETMPEPTERQGPSTYSEARNEGSALTSERNVQRMFNRDLALQATRAGYRSAEEMPVPEREAFHQNWQPGEIYEQAGGRGLRFLSIIARAFARLLFDEAKKKVKLDTDNIK